MGHVVAPLLRPAGLGTLLLEQQCWVFLSRLLLEHESPEGEQRVPLAVLNGNPIVKKSLVESKVVEDPARSESENTSPKR